MAALYLHNSIWVPDAETPLGSSPQQHTRTISSSTLQTDQSHFTQPLLQTNTSESVAYLDLLSRQPTHPSEERGDPVGLNFQGDPTTTRERKGFAERRIRRRLRRLKGVIAGLELIMVAWSLYTTIRYFLAFDVYPTSTGEATALALGTVSAVAIALLLGVAVIPFLKPYFLASVEILLTIRLVLRYLFTFFLLAPSLVNFALVFAWRHASTADLGMRCSLDVDVVWSVRAHPSCSHPPPFAGWFGLAIARLIVTAAIITVYHLTLASYARLRRPSLHRHRSNNSETTFLGSASPRSGLMSMSGATLSPPSRHRQIPTTSSSTLTVGSNPSFRLHRSGSSRGGSGSLQSTPEHRNGGLELEFDPYANLPASGSRSGSGSSPPPAEPEDRDLQSFVERLRLLVAQTGRESSGDEDGEEDGLPSSSSLSSSLPFSFPGSGSFSGPGPGPGSYGSAAYPYDEFGRPADHVRILNSYIRRMPTIESIGSREVGTGTASTSVATASLYQEVLLGGGGARSRSGTGDWSTSEGAGQHVPSRPVSGASLHGAAVAAALQEITAGVGGPRERRHASTGSGLTFGSGSPLTTPITEEPASMLPSATAPAPTPAPSPAPASPTLSVQSQSRRVRPLPRPPLPRADSI